MATAPSPPPPSAPRPRAWLGRALLGVLAGVGLYVALAVATDARGVLQATRQLRGGGWALALALVTASYVLRSLRWRLYLHRLAATPPDGPVPFVPGLALGLTGGRWGQVVKAYYLREAARKPYVESVPAVVAERVADAASVALLLVVGLVVGGATNFGLVLGASLLLAGVYLAARHEGLARVLVGLLQGLPWVRRHGERILTGHRRLRGHLALRDLAAPAGVGLAAISLEALALWALAVEGLGLALSPGACMLIVATADLAGMLAMVPGGLGATEGSLLVLLGLQGVPLPEATALALAFRACSLWFGLVLGAAGAGALVLMRPWRGRVRDARAPAQA